MNEKRRLDGRRARAVVGGGVGVVALAALGVLVSGGFAKGPVTATQPQFDKVVICHKTQSTKNPSVTITISRAAWQAHPKHGDTLGACVTMTAARTTTTTSSSTTSSSATPGGEHGKAGQHGNAQGLGRGRGK